MSSVTPFQSILHGSIARTATGLAGAVQYGFALLCALRLPDACQTPDGAVRFRRVGGLQNDAWNGTYAATYEEQASGQMYRVTIERVTTKPVAVKHSTSLNQRFAEAHAGTALAASCGVSEGDAA